MITRLRWWRSAIVMLLMVVAQLPARGSSMTAETTLIPWHARRPAPSFSLTDAKGARIALSRQKGHVVLLDFWATWCTGCKVEIPWYIEFQKKYARQGLRSTGVAMDDEGWTIVKPYLAAHPINYPIVLGNPTLVKPYNITNMPVTLLIDRSGNIADAHVGMVDRDIWEEEIQQLLKEQKR